MSFRDTDTGNLVYVGTLGIGAYIGLCMLADFTLQSINNRFGLDAKHKPKVEVLKSSSKKSKTKDITKQFEVITDNKKIKHSLKNTEVLKDGFTHQINGFEIHKKNDEYLRLNFSYYVNVKEHPFGNDITGDKNV